MGALGLADLVEDLHSKLYLPEPEALLEDVAKLKEQNELSICRLKNAEEEMKKLMVIAEGAAHKRKRRQVDNEGGPASRRYTKRTKREITSDGLRRRPRR